MIQYKKLTPYQKECLINFVGRKCETCGKNEAQVGKLEIHRPHQGQPYSLRNSQVDCGHCHDFYSSAQRIASGSQSR